MKIVKIGAIWCSGCLVMNKVWNQLKEHYDFDAIELDYDMDEDEVNDYHPGDVLPLFIVYSNQEEVLRFAGEVKYEEMVQRIQEVGDFVEKNS